MDHISVCICTYKRPTLLVELIGKIKDQITDNKFSISIVVVDNDGKQSAKLRVEKEIINNETRIYREQFSG